MQQPCVCIQCKKAKQASEFKSRNGRKRKVCIPCDQANNLEVDSRKLRREQPALDLTFINAELIKECRACYSVFEAKVGFRPSKLTSDGYQTRCKECQDAKHPTIPKAKYLASVVAEPKEGLPAALTTDVQVINQLEVKGEKPAAKIIESAVAVEQPAFQYVVGDAIEVAREDVGVSDVVNELIDVKEAAEDLVEEVVEAAQTTKGFIARIKAWFKRWF